MLQRTLDKLHAKDWNLSNKEVSVAGAFLPYIGEHAPAELTQRVIESFVHQKSEAVCEKMFLDLVEKDQFGTARSFLHAAAENEKNPQLAANLLIYSHSAAFRHAYTKGNTDFTDMLVDTAHAEGIKLERPTFAGDMLGDAGYRILGKAEDHEITEKTKEFLEATRNYAARLDRSELVGETLTANSFDLLAAVVNKGDTESLRLVLDELKATGPQAVADALIAEEGYALLASCAKGNSENVRLLRDTMREASEQLGKPELMHEFLGAREFLAISIAYDNKAFALARELWEDMKVLPAPEGSPLPITVALQNDVANPLEIAIRKAPLEEVQWLVGEASSYAQETQQPELMTKLLEKREHAVLVHATLSEEPEMAQYFLDFYKAHGEAIGRPDFLFNALTHDGFEATIVASFGKAAGTMKTVLDTLEAEAEALGKPETMQDLLAHNRSSLLYNASDKGVPEAVATILGAHEDDYQRTGDGEALKTALTSTNYCVPYVMSKNGHSEALGSYFDTLERAADTLENPEIFTGVFSPETGLMQHAAAHNHAETLSLILQKAAHASEKYDKPQLLTDLFDKDAISLAVFSAAEENDSITQMLLDAMDEAAKKHPDTGLPPRAEAARVGVNCIKLNREQDVAGIQSQLETLPEEMRKEVIESFAPGMRKAFATDMPENARLREMGKGNTRWNAVLRMDAPHPDLETFSPQGFSPKTFKLLLPVIEEACELEGCPKKAPVMAYKASLLFSNPQELDRYLTTFSDKWAKTHTPVSEALSFEVPKRGKWTPKQWKDATLQFGPAVSRFIENAPQIEEHLAEHSLSFPQSPREMRPVAAQIVYERAEENPRFAEVALEYDLDAPTYIRGLDLLKEKAKTTDKLPDVTIDGKDVGQENYYFTKLEPDDPRGLLLGEITNCCQSIGHAGEAFAIHGATSENSGFYVWKQKTKGEMTPTDPIIAQSWAWIGQQGELVLDSFESLDNKTYHKLVEPFLGAFSERTLGKHSFGLTLPDGEKSFTLDTIHMGSGGYNDLDYSNRIELPYPMAELAVKPIDLEGELPDSKNQYVVASLRGKEAPPPAEKSWAQRIRTEQAATQHAQLGG